jgi:hypothetical protein
MIRLSVYQDCLSLVVTFSITYPTSSAISQVEGLDLCCAKEQHLLKNFTTTEAKWGIAYWMLSEL